MPSSADLFARALQLMPGGVNSPVRAFRSVGGAPFFVKRAKGAHLITADDHTLIDFVCTWGPAIHGHNHPRIRAAIAAALENGTSFGTPNPYEVEMAELIVRFVLGGECRHRLELNNDRTTYDQIGAEFLSERPAFVEHCDLALGQEGDAAFAQLSLKRFLIDLLGESVAEFVVHLEGGGHEIVAFLLKRFVVGFHDMSPVVVEGGGNAKLSRCLCKFDQKQTANTR